VTDAINARDAALGGFINPRGLHEYADRYAGHFALSRSDGILEIRAHTNGGAARWSRGLLNAWSQVLADAAADRANEIIILTGTGEAWLQGVDPASFAEPLRDWHPDLVWEQYRDGLALIERLVFDVQVPTIGVLNGPGPRQELPLLCDVTVCADNVTIADGNFSAGSVPGDGMFLVLSELLGPKRATWSVYTGQGLSATDAVTAGVVTEVVARADLRARAREIAQMILQRPRTARRMTHTVIARRWQRQVTAALREQYAQQLLSVR
jgi:enoyl-CoA hydratase/carnithine racemase